MSRVILHCDMNNCFASIEAVLNPALKGKKIAVCGSEKERHGIVLAKSEEAKQLGVKTGETIREALIKCPDLLIVPPHYEEYILFSRRARKIYEDYTDQVEPFGLDECWLDISGSLKILGSKEKIAEEIRMRIKDELGITVSIGVSFNKIFAKLGSDLKKPDAITYINKNDFREKLWPLPATALMGIGKSTAKKLAVYGIKTIGDLAKSSPELLAKRLGINGPRLWEAANGRESSRVLRADQREPIKSIGKGATCTENLVSIDEVRRVFLALAQNVSDRLYRHGLIALAIQIQVKNSSLISYNYQKELALPTRCAGELAPAATELFCDKHHLAEPIRALTLRAIKIKPDDYPVQYDIFTRAARHERQIRAEDAIFEIRSKYGESAIKPASLLMDNKLPKKAMVSRFPFGQRDEAPETE